MTHDLMPLAGRSAPFVQHAGATDTEKTLEAADFADTIRQITALGRFGRTSEVAAAVTFLAGLESAYVTGATLNVDGGFTV